MEADEISARFLYSDYNYSNNGSDNNEKVLVEVLNRLNATTMSGILQSFNSSDGQVEQASNGISNSTFEGLDFGLLLPMTPPNISSTSQTSRSSSDSFIMPIWAEALWTTVFTLMILVATGGNCIVIWIVTAHRKMRTVTNYFLVNLSTADLLLTTFNCVFNFSYMIQRNWPFGSGYCIVSNFIANATVAASVFTLTGISCDRYLAIVHPLHPRMSKTSSLITIMFIWIASMFVAFPCLLYSTTITAKYNGKETTGCILIWPDGKKVGSDFDFAYQMGFLIVTYVIPVILMSMSYTVMGKELWGSRSIGEMTQRQIDSIRSKRKVVKMFILIVFIFAICWLPYHAYFLYVYYDTTIIYSKYTQHVYLGFYWFAMSNAMVNPLIYYWMNARFRQYFKTAICGWKKCIKNTHGHSGEDIPLSGDRNFLSLQSQKNSGCSARSRCENMKSKSHPERGAATAGGNNHMHQMHRTRMNNIMQEEKTSKTDVLSMKGSRKWFDRKNSERAATVNL